MASKTRARRLAPSTVLALDLIWRFGFTVDSTVGSMREALTSMVPGLDRATQNRVLARMVQEVGA